MSLTWSLMKYKVSVMGGLHYNEGRVGSTDEAVDRRISLLTHSTPGTSERFHHQLSIIMHDPTRTILENTAEWWRHLLEKFT